MSLQAKVLTAFLAVALLVTLLLSGVASVLLNNLFSRYLEATLSTRLSELKSALEDHYEHQGSFVGADIFVRGRSMMMGGHGYVVVDGEGTVVIGPPALVGQRLTTRELSQGITLQVRGKKVGTLIANSMMGRMSDLAPLEHEFRTSFYHGVLASGAFVLLLSLGLGVIVSRRLVAPLKEIDKAASTLGAGDLSYRLPHVYNENELKNLIHSFNDMAMQLEQNERSRRNLVADVAHELRTPITILRVALESMLDGVARPDEAQIASLYEEVDRMGRLITDLQDLSSAEAGKLTLRRAELDLGGIILKCIEHIRPLADEKGISLNYEAVEPVTVVADKDRLSQVVYNIVSNAIQHTQQAGVVSVSLAIKGTFACITVADTGSGIAPEDLPYVFDRFYRVDKARHREGGSGLGLAISKEFVQAMGGNLAVSSILGQGTTFDVCLPLQQSLE